MLGRKRQDKGRGMMKEDGKKPGRRRKTQCRKGNCVASERQRRTPKVCKALVKARRIRGTKPPGSRGVDAKLLFHLTETAECEKKTHRQSTAPSANKDQNCQEPLKEEEYKKLRDILQQRDNEISILSAEIRDSSSLGLDQETLSYLPLATSPSSPPN